jgi:chromosomal replication initiation ATPase DnaA
MTMAGSGRQMVLDLPHRPALGREDFLVTDSNRAAVSAIEGHAAWPHHALAIVGPPGSGKSHLIEVWRQMTGAPRIPADGLREADVPQLMREGVLAIDDAPGAQLDERALFHLLNLARQQQGRVLFASLHRPAAWRVGLPDLASRLKAVPYAELGPPDDALLRGVLVKLFADRQLVVEEPAISFLLLRMQRSLEAARELVAVIDRRALEQKTAITRSFLGKILAETPPPHGPETED